MTGVRYDPDKHFEDCLLTWKDAGWFEKGQEKAAGEFIDSGSALVGIHQGRAVALATSGRGTFKHFLFNDELQFCSINSVNVAFHGRKKGFAALLTAELLAQAAENGVACAGLGMFEQGFYDRLGFANMPYWKSVYLRPSEISLQGRTVSDPVRLNGDDWEEVHNSRTKRLRGHGSINLEPSSTRAAFDFSPGCFVLGFRNEREELTHHVFFEKIRNEHGPVFTGWLCFRNSEQFRDLLLLIKNMGDQIDLIRISEPGGIQIQSLLNRPLASGRRTLNSGAKRVETRALSWTQCRILNLDKCIQGLVCPGGKCSFNLRLTDPVNSFLDKSFSWRGTGGDYAVKLSDSSDMAKGFIKGLPLLECSVNAFTKLWNGTTRATMLPYTEKISAPAELLEKIDESLFMPEPAYDWEL